MIATPAPTPSPEQGLYTLDPLIDRGPHALAPDLALGIREVVVQELGIIWDNGYQEVVVRRASNVIQCVEAGGSVSVLLPRGARPLFAVLRFHVVGAGRPALPGGNLAAAYPDLDAGLRGRPDENLAGDPRLCPHRLAHSPSAPSQPRVTM
jgi:hypothetical protein